MRYSKFPPIFSPLVPLLLIVACGPQGSQKSIQANLPPSGSKTTSTTEIGPDSQSPEKLAKTKEAIIRLMQFPSGNLILSTVRPKGFEDILPVAVGSTVPCLVQLSSGDQIKGKNGHSGGGIERRSDGIFVIQANQDSDADLLAHILRHEMNHIIEDIELDVLEKSGNYVDIVNRVVTTLKTRNPDAINQVVPREIEYVLSMLMCAEVRSYGTNQKLEQEGLPFRTFSFATESIDLFVNKVYLEPYYRKFTDNDAVRVGNACRSKKNLLEFMQSISGLLNASGA
jgi:hypothetical protein